MRGKARLIFGRRAVETSRPRPSPPSPHTHETALSAYRRHTLRLLLPRLCPPRGYHTQKCLLSEAAQSFFPVPTMPRRRVMCESRCAASDASTPRGVSASSFVPVRGRVSLVASLIFWFARCASLCPLLLSLQGEPVRAHAPIPSGLRTRYAEERCRGTERRRAPWLGLCSMYVHGGSRVHAPFRSSVRYSFRVLFHSSP